jgi:hemerythrin-like domain-containing protein
MEGTDRDRRTLIALPLAFGAATLAAACASAGEKRGEGKAGEDVGPAEDLMREHGVLDRMLLVDEECARRLAEPGAEAAAPTLLEVLRGNAELAKKFVHGYHEELEEKEVFPRLEAAGREATLCGVLRAQHAAGRRVTDRIRALVADGFPHEAKDRQELGTRLGEFVRMYRPHAAREDTVILPAFHRLFDPRAWDELGEKFEDREKEVIGDRGFERSVEQVAGYERALGIHDLAKFTASA